VVESAARGVADADDCRGGEDEESGHRAESADPCHDAHITVGE
jgi:hypothetical protein